MDFVEALVLYKMSKEKICGVYKITSPTGRIYIGQAIDIIRRFKEYRKITSKIKKQRKIYRSLLKYGVEAHTFEIIEECEIDDLDCRERYWQDFYDVLGDKGLNCILQECGEFKYVVSNETKVILSEMRQGEGNSFYGKSHTEHSKQLIREANLGKIMNEDTKSKISESLKGRVFTDEHREKLSLSGIGKKHTEVSKKKMSESAKGKIVSDETKKKLSSSIKGKMAKGKHPQAKLVLCTQTGVFYDCIEDASEVINMKSGTLRAMLNGRNPNKTNFILV